MVTVPALPHDLAFHMNMANPDHGLQAWLDPVPQPTLACCNQHLCPAGIICLWGHSAQHLAARCTHKVTQGTPQTRGRYMVNGYPDFLFG